MSQRRRWLALGLVLAPAGGAWALAQGGAPETAPAGPPVLVAEQVTVARHVVPFAYSGDGQTGTVWATGRTRAASTPEDGKNAKPPEEDAPAATVLVEGAVTADDRPTAWRRAEPPIDRDGNPIALGDWRLEDAETAATALAATSAGAALHAGAGTTAGAAAVLVRIREGGSSREAVLARTSDGRFRELPAPPIALGGPADAVTPIDVFDVPAPSGGPAPSADRGRTGVLLAPAGGVGVLVWDGAAWPVEPWRNADGSPAGARTALAIGATDSGDAVALFAGDATGGSAARVSLARRESDSGGGFRDMSIADAPLLDGPLPSTVTAIRPIAAPGQRLTVGDGHWWIDLRVERGGQSAVSATVHLVPGVDAARLTAKATGAWCQPVLAADSGCTRELGFEFATTRGYRSEVYAPATTSTGAEPTFGRRIITSPVIPESTGAAQVREASASGGYLSLEGERFALKSGVGDDGDDGTQSAVVARGGAVVLGGRRTVGRLMARRGGELAATDSVAPGLTEGIVDVSLSPSSVPAQRRGAIEITAAAQPLIQEAKDPWAFGRYPGLAGPGSPLAWVSALAWDGPDQVVVAGSGGIVATTEPPLETFQSSNSVTQPTVVEASRGMTLLDVATRDDAGWAVGRGAAVYRSAGEWKAVTIPAALKDATMLQVVYAGSDVLIASDLGLLVGSEEGQLQRDTALAALLTADGRSPAVASVAALPDGAAVVDGRYLRESGSGPWLRLASPAEGDVAAVALWRPRDGADGVEVVEASGTRRVTAFAVGASLGDTPRPAYGATPAPVVPDPGPAPGPDLGPFPTTNEAPPLVTDGRLSVLGRQGWRDVIGAPLHRSVGRDLARRSPVVSSLAVDASGTGWASGGGGSFLSTLGTESPLAEQPYSFELRMGEQDVPTSASTAPVAPKDDPARPPAGAVRLFVGGHPACLSECAGRGDQGLGPDTTLVRALRHVSDMTEPADGPAVVVIGGGRTARGTSASRAGLARYAELLSSSPGLTVAAVLGSGDAPNSAARLRFRQAMAPFFHRTSTGDGGVVPVTEPRAPVDDPTSDAVAYAFDVPAAGAAQPARVVVIDNAGGVLRGGADGPQAEWLLAVLRDGAQRGLTSVVVGAARLDDGADRATDRAAQLDLLARGGANLYVATDGTDDLASAAAGLRIVSQNVQASGRAIRQIRSAALGYAAVPWFFTGLEALQGEARREAEAEAIGGWTGRGLVALNVTAGRPVDPSIVPVVDEVASFVYPSERGVASFIFPLSASSAYGGYRATNPAQPALLEQDVRPGNGVFSSAFLDISASSCRVFSEDAFCTGLLPVDAAYRVGNPALATFVRARPGRSQGSPPEIVVDAQGNPVPDPTSSVLCATGVGETTVSVTVSGQTLTFPLRITEPTTPVPKQGKAPCAFTVFTPPETPKPNPDPAPVVPTPIAPVVPQVPSPQPQPDPGAASKPKPTPTPVVVPTPAPLLAPVFVPSGPESATPPVTAKPKPAPPAPIPPPSGLAAQFQPAPQVQQVTAVASQQQRREELAREGSIQRAAAYEREPDPVGVGALLLGGVGLLLAAGAGGAVIGTRRRAAAAASRAHAHTRR